MGKKRLILAMVMLLSVPTVAHAQIATVEGSVTFTGEGKLDSNGTAELNAAVGALQPGDGLVIQIMVENSSDRAANYFLTNEVVNSLENTEGTEASGGAYEYVLTYMDSNGIVTDLFRSTALGGEGTTVDGRAGLKGATSGLEEYIYLDTLESGQKGKVTLQIGLDGETHGNSYQGTAANLQMNFAVDTDMAIIRNISETVTRYETIEIVDDTNPIDAEGGRRSNSIVRTGDDTNLIPFFFAAGGSGILLLFLAVFGMKERKKQKKGAAALGVILASVLTVAVPMSVQAGSYTYTVRLYAGAQGRIVSEGVVSVPENANVEIRNGGNYLEVSNLNYGDRIHFNANVEVGSTETVFLTADEAGTSKYYVQGVKKSGQEINIGDDEVTEDRDYVISYGVRGNMTYYRVNYIDQEGNTLLPSQRYSGKIGDFAVAAYRYVEGYQPYAYNLGKTLTADETENVFDFVYAPLPEVVITTTQTVTNTTTVTGMESAVGRETDETASVAVASPVPEQEDSPEPEAEDIGDTIIPEAGPGEPEDFVNLDEQETPLAPGPDKGEESNNGLEDTIEDAVAPLAALPTAAKAGIAVCGVLAAVAAIWFLIGHRKKENKEDEAQ